MVKGGPISLHQSDMLTVPVTYPKHEASSLVGSNFEDLHKLEKEL